MTRQIVPNSSASKALAPTPPFESNPNQAPAECWTAGVCQELVTLMFYMYDFL